MVQSFLKRTGLKLACLAIALALAGCSAAGNSDIAFPMQVAQLQPTGNSPTTSYGPTRCAPTIRSASKSITNQILPATIRLIVPATCQFHWQVASKPQD